MADKHVNRCFTSYVIRELQIKITRYYYTLEQPKSKTLTTPNAGEDVEQQERSLIAGGNAKRHSHFGRQFGAFLQNILLPYDPAINQVK